VSRQHEHPLQGTRLRSLHLGKASAGVASNGVGLAIGVLIQVISVPAFLKGLGAPVYGDWLVLSAIPAYLTLGDLGFASVSSSQATREAAVGAFKGAQASMRSAWLAVNLLSSVILAVVGPAVLFTSVQVLPIHTISNDDARRILLLLVGYTLITLQSSVVEGCFRAGGRFPAGIIIANLVRLVEFLVAALIGLWCHNPVAVAGALFGSRLLGHAVYMILLAKLVPGMTLGVRGAEMSRIRALLAPSLGFLSFPLGNALAVQGMVMVTAAELGATAVVTLNALRVMVNLLRQLGSAVYNGVLPEVTFAIGSGNSVRAGRLVHNSLVATLSIAGVCAVVLATAGDAILTIWSDGAVQASFILVLAMLATVLADLPWLAWSLPLLARNEHQVLGLLYAGSCLLAVGAATFLMPHMGLLAVPLTLFLVDAVLYVPAYRGSARVLGAGDSTIPSLGGPSRGAYG
jgi:O-antigen/teichoic acid export membrane protein